jgi:acetyltransferase-like isoleucine patch superfamily enzyme
MTGISSLARVSPRARIGTGCTIGDFTIVHDDVVLGDGSTIESHCVIGRPTQLAEGAPLVIGPGALIRSHAVFYQGSTFGPNLVTGHHVAVREKLTAGTNLQVGTFTEFQGQARVGDHVRTQSRVFVGQATTIGDFVWLFPSVVLTNDPHPPSEVRMGVVLEDFASIGAMSTILPGVRVGTRSLVAASSMVNRDVPPDMVVGGVPAKSLGPTSRILHKQDGKPAYPWVRHFHRGYPEAMVQEWQRRLRGSSP